MNSFTLNLKEALHKKALENLQMQINDIEKQLADLKTAGESEGKSSAGDKFETQREMIKQSRDMLDFQLARLLQMLQKLKNTPLIEMQKVQEGALVKLPHINIWVTVALGKIKLDEKEYQLVSNESPLFQAIKNLRAGESTTFRGQELVVEDVI